MISIRSMTNADLDFALAQTEREGWATSRHMFEVYLAHGLDGCLVAKEDDELVGMVTTTRYIDSAWIGNLIVIPRARSRGVGRRLMERGLRHLEERGASTVRLDGDPPGIALYRSLGFVDEWESLRYKGFGTDTTQPAGLREFTPTDLLLVAAMDRAAFGDDRLALLRLQLTHAHSAFLAERNGEATGFMFTEPTNLGLRIGPWVARDARAAADLLSAARQAAGPETTLTLGVPEDNRECRLLLESLAFQRTPSSRRMVRGAGVACLDPGMIFAIGGGAVG